MSIGGTGREPPLLMNNCKINPEWERWLNTNHPAITVELTNANIFMKMLYMRAMLDIVLKESWNDYSAETLALIKEHPEHWHVLQTLNPPKPTMLQRIIRFFKRDK
jgi:hypothetical protein